MSTSKLKKYDFSSCTKQELDVLYTTISGLYHKKLQEEKRTMFHSMQGKCFSVKYNIKHPRYRVMAKAVLEFGEVHVINRKEIMSINGIIIMQRHSPEKMKSIFYGTEKHIVHGFILSDETVQNAIASAMVDMCMASAKKGKNIIPHSRYLQLLKKYDNEVGVEI
jgi:hypothetical protein